MYLSFNGTYLTYIRSNSRSYFNINKGTSLLTEHEASEVHAHAEHGDEHAENDVHVNVD